MSDVYLNCSILAEYAINCSDFPVLRMIIFDYGNNTTAIFGNKIKDMVIEELDAIKNFIERQAKEKESELSKNLQEYKGKEKSVYSLIYHQLASLVEQELQKFHLKYPLAHKLVVEKIKDVSSQINDLENKLELLETYGNRRKIVLTDSCSFFSDDLDQVMYQDWSPYEQTFSFIWRKYEEGGKETKKKRTSLQFEDAVSYSCIDESDLFDKKKIKGSND